MADARLVGVRQAQRQSLDVAFDVALLVDQKGAEAAAGDLTVLTETLRSLPPYALDELVCSMRVLVDQISAIRNRA